MNYKKVTLKKTTVPQQHFYASKQNQATKKSYDFFKKIFGFSQGKKILEESPVCDGKYNGLRYGEPPLSTLNKEW